MLMSRRVERDGAGSETVPACDMVEYARIAKARAEERNIRALILRKPVLSRGNWRSGARSAKAEFGRPWQKRRQRHIQKSSLEHEQERYRKQLSVGRGVPDEVAEIDRETQLRDGQRRFKRAIAARSPALGATLDSIFRCPSKIGFVIKNGLQNGAGIVQGKTYPQRKQTREEQHLFHPTPGMKLTLRANVKHRHRN